jgi:hypothetical protein
MKAYKGFNKDMTCRGFHYEEGKEYEHKGGIDMCLSGFHACERPIDVLAYYPPGTSVYHEVEQNGEIKKGDDKTCSAKIRIGAKIDIIGMVNATIEYVKSKCTNENNAKAGEPATAGPRGAATAGDYGAATAGPRGAATAGDSGAATAGDSGAATSRGKSSSGKHGLSVARGNNVRVRGGIGAILVIAEENESSYDIKDFKVAVVDGVTIKAGTWYRLKNGELIECDD